MTLWPSHAYRRSDVFPAVKNDQPGQLTPGTVVCNDQCLDCIYCTVSLVTGACRNERLSRRDLHTSQGGFRPGLHDQWEQADCCMHSSMSATMTSAL